jgi:hypothetical protein
VSYAFRILVRVVNVNEQTATASPDVLKNCGNVEDEKFLEDLFKDGLELYGQTSALLVTGKGRKLRGSYLDQYI